VRLPRVVEPLRHRDFRLLWTGQTLTLLGSFVSNIAYPFQVLQLGGSAIELGTLVSAYTGASLIFLLIGGAVADRVPRRTLIVVTELGSGVIVGIVALLGFAGALQIWHLYVTYALFGAASAFSVPALGAIIPELVPEDILIAGNAVQGLSRQGARVGGPIVGGLLVAAAGPPAAFAFDALSFFTFRRRRRAHEGTPPRQRGAAVDPARDTRRVRVRLRRSVALGHDFRLVADRGRLHRGDRGCAPAPRDDNARWRGRHVRDHQRGRRYW
jgi:MFS family permease